MDTDKNPKSLKTDRIDNCMRLLIGYYYTLGFLYQSKL